MPASPVWYLNLPTLTDGASPPDPPEWYLNLPDPNPKPGGKPHGPPYGTVTYLTLTLALLFID